MNREKVSVLAKTVVKAVSEMNFDPNECVALLKCLENVFQTRCIEKDLVVAPLNKIKEVCKGLAPIESLLPQGRN